MSLPPPEVPPSPAASDSRLAALAPIAGLIALLALAWACYQPGMTGGFLFDDFINLDALGRFQPWTDAGALLRYLTSGTADPLGRPLSLLTFLGSARAWPDDAAPFLRVNLWLHLLNGALLFAWLRQLQRLVGGPRPGLVAWLGTGLWVVHPLLVSTTLYVVQREAMLPATFVLAGLLAYGHGRARFAATGGRAGLGWMTAGLVAGTVLAMACKANGVLMPLLAGVLELTVLPAATTPAAAARLRRWRGFALGLPTLAIAAYLASYLPHLGEVPTGRDWSLGERLLTEPRVLLDYLRAWALPSSTSSGLYQDAYAASTGWLTPVSTLPAVLAVLAAVIAAWAGRRRAPALAAAVLFFFGAHLLESTVVPLELFFEHRNYLPALLLGWPLARAVAAWRTRDALRTGTAVALVALLAFTTWQRAGLWGDSERLARLWLQQAPDSPRAQATSAQAAIAAGDVAAADSILTRGLQVHPDEPQLAISWVVAACNGRGVEPRHDAAMRTSLARARTGQMLVFQALGDWIDPAAAGLCPGLTLARLESWIVAAQGNARLMRDATSRQNAQRLLARLALARGDVAGARERFALALALRPAPDVAIADAGMLAVHGSRQDALALLDAYAQLPPPPAPRLGMARVHAWVLQRQQYWPRRIGQLRAELAAIGDRPPGDSR
jgi:hypothetical protein